MNGQKKYLIKANEIGNNQIPGNVRIIDLIDNYFQAYNAARMKEAAHLFAQKMLKNDVTVGLSLSGALTPAGLGGTCIAPLMKKGFIDRIAGTGENLYHDYFIQITDARPDTGGLSGATPSEGVTWGKIDPERLPDTVVAYVDLTIALPMITSYAMAKVKSRPLKRLFFKREAMLGALYKEYLKVN